MPSCLVCKKNLCRKDFDTELMKKIGEKRCKRCVQLAAHHENENQPSNSSETTGFITPAPSSGETMDTDAVCNSSGNNKKEQDIQQQEQLTDPSCCDYLAEKVATTSTLGNDLQQKISIEGISQLNNADVVGSEVGQDLNNLLITKRSERGNYDNPPYQTSPGDDLNQSYDDEDMDFMTPSLSSFIKSLKDKQQERIDLFLKSPDQQQMQELQDVNYFEEPESNETSIKQHLIIEDKHDRQIKDEILSRFQDKKNNLMSPEYLHDTSELFVTPPPNNNPSFDMAFTEAKIVALESNISASKPVVEESPNLNKLEVDAAAGRPVTQKDSLGSEEKPIMVETMKVRKDIMNLSMSAIDNVVESHCKGSDECELYENNTGVRLGKNGEKNNQEISPSERVKESTITPVISPTVEKEEPILEELEEEKGQPINEEEEEEEEENHSFPVKEITVLTPPQQNITMGRKQSEKRKSQLHQPVPSSSTFCLAASTPHTKNNPSGVSDFSSAKKKPTKTPRSPIFDDQHKVITPSTRVTLAETSSSAQQRLKAKISDATGRYTRNVTSKNEEATQSTIRPTVKLNSVAKAATVHPAATTSNKSRHRHTPEEARNKARDRIRQRKDKEESKRGKQHKQNDSKRWGAKESIKNSKSPKVSPNDAVARARERVRQRKLKDKAAEERIRAENNTRVKTRNSSRRVTVPASPKFAKTARIGDQFPAKEVGHALAQSSEGFRKALRSGPSRRANSTGRFLTKKSTDRDLLKTGRCDDISVTSIGSYNRRTTVPCGPTFATTARHGEKKTPPPRGSIVQNSDVKKMGLRDDMSVNSSRSYKRPTTVPLAPNFATTVRYGEKKTPSRRRIARNSDAQKMGLREDMSVSSSGSYNRPTTIPRAPNFVTTARYGEKETPSKNGKVQPSDAQKMGLRDDMSVSSSGSYNRPLTISIAPNFETTTRRGAKATPTRRPLVEEMTLAQSTDILCNELRENRPLSPYKGDRTLTIPLAPKLHKTTTSSFKAKRQNKYQSKDKDVRTPFRAKPAPKTTYRPNRITTTAKESNLSTRK